MWIGYDECFYFNPISASFFDSALVMFNCRSSKLVFTIERGINQLAAGKS